MPKTEEFDLSVHPLIASLRAVRPSVSELSILFVLLGNPASLRAQNEPLSPVAPTSVEECKAFSISMSTFLNAMSKAHGQCLGEKMKEGSKGSMETESRICAYPACQQYHLDPDRLRQ